MSLISILIIQRKIDVKKQQIKANKKEKMVDCTPDKTYEGDDYYINRTIMIMDKDKQHYSFYKVNRCTAKMFWLDRLKCESHLVREKDGVKTYEAKMTQEIDEGKKKRIMKKNIVNCPLMICSIAQYEI
jgi:beta-lactamase class D